MKKIQLVLFILLAVIFYQPTADGQGLNFDQKMKAVRAIDSLLYNFQQLGKFISPGSDTITEASIDQYRSMFSPDADVWDEYTPDYYRNPVSDNPYQLSDRSLDQYLKNVKDFYNKGIDQLVISNLAVNINDFQNNVVYVILEKSFRARSPKTHAIINNKDTLMLTVTLIEDYSKAIITRVSNNGSVTRVKISNDKDKDLVVDIDDKFPNIPGLIEFNGAPSPRGYLLSLNLNAGVSKSFILFNDNEQTSFKDNLQAGYQNRYSNNLFDTGTDSIGTLSFKNAKQLQFHFAGELEMFVGNKRHLGFGVGVFYTQSEQNLVLSQFHVEYGAIDSFNNARIYRRIVDGNNGEVTEKVKYSMVSIPLFVKYKINFYKKDSSALKSFLKLSFGVGYTLPGKLITDYNAQFNYTGVFTLDDKNQYAFKPPSNASVVIDQNAIQILKEKYGNEILNNGFLNNFGVDDSPSGRDTFQLSNKISNFTFIFKPQFSYLLTERISLNVGAVFLFTNLDIPASTNGIEGFVLTDKKQEYNSLITGLNKIQFYNGGINVGISIGLIR